MKHPLINLDNYPELKNEWSNKNLSSWKELHKSYDYIWECPIGHDYTLKLVHRIERGLKCPYCAGQRVLVGFNDVATTDPQMIEKFSHNSPYSPTDVTRGSKRRALFLCDKGHEYEQIIKNAVILNRGCPYCSGYLKKVGYNDLQTSYPEIAEEYHIDNDIPVESIWGVAIEDYRINAKWVCRHNNKHVWESSLYHRISEKKLEACPYCRGVINENGVNDLETLYPLLKNEWSDNNEKPLSAYTYQSCYKALWECDKGHEWNAYIFHRTNGNGRCIICYPIESSQETEMFNFLKGFLKNETIIKNDRKILNGKKLDFYIPSQKIAIEMNGIYWHSEISGRTKNYHYDKWKECQNQGIQLITIWEDEWKNKRKIIENLIKSKLHISDLEKIPARKTIIEKISPKEAKSFLLKHHVQGEVDGKYNYALKYDNEIVSVIVLNKTQNEEDTYNIIRFCSSQNVQGGFSKLLHHATKDIKNVKYIYTFSDNCKSNGKLYSSNGFILEKNLKPNYMYVIGKKRFHKFSFRKSTFKNNAKLLYDEDLSESQLAVLNNIYRIWDCGKQKWKLTVKII